MRRIRLTVAYDGTNYCGWQVQPGLETIEGALNSALSALCGEEISVIGASRTDSGVHAHGNIAVFDTNSRIPAEKFSFAVNQRLPQDIRVRHSEECSGNWHPRKTGGVKTYEYKIYNERISDPMHRLYTHHCHYALNLSDMRAAAAYLVGEHDFTSFANPDSQVLRNGGSAVREIYGIEILAERDVAEAGKRGFCGLVTIRISGSGFLYNMVRIIAGTLLQAGSGLYAPSHVREILSARDRQAAGPTAEAKGLCLVGLSYEE